VREGVAGWLNCGAEGVEGEPFAWRDFAPRTVVKGGSESLGDVVSDEEYDGGTFVCIRLGEGGGREEGVEGMACHSRWNRRKG
jgi:hypothetical protein